MRQYSALLRHNRNYRLLWIAQVVSELGDWFYSLAVYHLLPPALRSILEYQPAPSRC